MSKPRGKRQTQGPLKDHYKQGKVYRPLMTAYDATHASDWVRDDLPDLLWPAVFAHRFGSAGAAEFRKLQEAVIAAVGGDTLDGAGAAFDGRLSSLEFFPERLRQQVIEFITSPEWLGRSMAREICSILRWYEAVPGAWLLVEPLRDRVDANPEDASLLLKIIVKVIRDGHLNALVKCAPFGWLLLRGKITVDSSMVDLLRDYPTNEATRSAADSVIRASFGAHKGADELSHPERFQRSAEWARSFWNQNWRMFPCFPEEHADASADEVDSHCSEAADEITASDDQPTVHQRLAADHELAEDDASAAPLDRVVSLFEGFMAEAMDSNKPVDLYAPAKHEVICGFISRAARTVYATLRAPHLWSGEHGMSTMRILSESKIILEWMSRQDALVYGRYQKYGQGKAKLMKIHMQSLAESFEDGPPPQLSEALDHFSKRLGGEWGEQFLDVNLDSTFSGLSVRDMALAVDLGDEYRHIYQPASGIAHGEWWTVEDYAMQRCMNPLHLFHRIPSLNPEFPVTLAFADLLVDRLDALIRQALRCLFADESVDP